MTTFTGACLLVCVLLTVGSCFFQALMPTPMEKLQYTAPITTLGVFFLTVAVWLGDADWQARIKCLLVAGILFVMNGTLTHATARAFRIRSQGEWRALPEERA